MSAGRICVRDVDVAEAHENLQTAAARMLSRNVGALVVINDAREPIGILTDRDLVIKAMARGLGPFDATVGEIMTPDPRTVREDTSIEDALRRMRNGPYRRLPVVDDEGKLVGLLTLDDVLALLGEAFEEIRDLLRKESPIALAEC